MSKGLFISFEGGEGAGKSTQVARLAERLRAAGHEVVVSREPGGSPGAEAVRHVLLSGAAVRFGPAMEAVLFAAARADHVAQVIRPAVEAGAIVLVDRFMDSSRVYQGVIGALDPDFMQALEKTTVDGMEPDLTLILDLPAETGMARAHERRGHDNADRFEKEELAVHEKRRQAYLAIAGVEPERCRVIDATPDAETVAGRIDAAVDELLDQRGLVARGYSGEETDR